MADETRWLVGDVTGDGDDDEGRADLVHIWDGGINTLRSNGDGTNTLLRESWKPRPDYNMNVGFDVLGD